MLAQVSLLLIVGVCRSKIDDEMWREVFERIKVHQVAADAVYPRAERQLIPVAKHCYWHVVSDPRQPFPKLANGKDSWLFLLALSHGSPLAGLDNEVRRQRAVGDLLHQTFGVVQ